MFLSNAEKQTYEEEINKLKCKLLENEDRRLILAADKEKLQAEIETTKNLLTSARTAKKNDCLRGEYCRFCKHSVLVPRRPGDEYGEKCVCTYGACKHFEKEVAE